eukprot:g5702.t1
MDFDMLRDKLKEKKKEHQVARRNAVDPPPRERSREPRGENDRSKRDAGAGNGENKSSRRDVDALLDQRGGNKKDKDHRANGTDGTKASGHRERDRGERSVDDRGEKHSSAKQDKADPKKSSRDREQLHRDKERKGSASSSSNGAAAPPATNGTSGSTASRGGGEKSNAPSAARSDRERKKDKEKDAAASASGDHRGEKDKSSNKPSGERGAGASSAATGKEKERSREKDTAGANGAAADPTNKPAGEKDKDKENGAAGDDKQKVADAASGVSSSNAEKRKGILEKVLKTADEAVEEASKKIEVFTKALAKPLSEKNQDELTKKKIQERREADQKEILELKKAMEDVKSKMEKVKSNADKTKTLKDWTLLQFKPIQRKDSILQSQWTKAQDQAKRLIKDLERKLEATSYKAFGLDELERFLKKDDDKAGTKENTGAGEGGDAGGRDGDEEKPKKTLAAGTWRYPPELLINPGMYFGEWREDLARILGDKPPPIAVEHAGDQHVGTMDNLKLQSPARPGRRGGGGAAAGGREGTDRGAPLARTSSAGGMNVDGGDADNSAADGGAANGNANPETPRGGQGGAAGGMNSVVGNDGMEDDDDDAEAGEEYAGKINYDEVELSSDDSDVESYRGGR